jgi:hypothetical protein
MEMDPNPPSFNIPYSVPPMNIGEGYAKGITAAGESLSKATSSVFDVMNRNRTADDMLTTMQSSGMLSPEAYKAVAGKSLGAKESMVGLYAGQWIADQAEKRSQALQMGKSTADIATAHAQVLEAYDAIKKGYPQVAGIQPGKLQVTPQTGPGATAQSAPALAPLQPGQGVPALSTGLSGTPAAPTPLGTNVTNPPVVTSPQLAAAQTQKAQQTKLTVGPPLGKEPVPPGGRLGTVNGQRGVLLPDGVTFRPLQ